MKPAPPATQIFLLVKGTKLVMMNGWKEGEGAWCWCWGADSPED